MEDGEEITEEFLGACSELELGELAKYRNFNLADAMSAIVAFDPKMDSGIEPIDEALGFDEAVENGGLNVKKMELAELIATVDGTLAMIVSWLNGQSLDQTIYTNVCLLKCNKLEDKILSAFSLSTLHFVGSLKNCIEIAGVFNEEDFSSITCHSELQSPQNCPELLEGAMKVVSRRMQDKSEPASHLEAVSARLQLYNSLFELFRHLLSVYSNDSSNKLFVPNLKKSALAVDKCLFFVKLASKTVAAGGNAPNCTDADFSWLPAFQPQVNRQFSPPSFPREPILVTRNEAYLYFDALLKKIKQMLAEIPEKMRELDGLIQFFQTFGGDDSCILSRSIVQLLIMPNDYTICGTLSLSNIIHDSITRLDVSLLDGLALNGQLNASILDEFVMFCVRAFVGLFQTLGHNLARQRDKLLETCFEDLCVLRGEAEKIEVANYGAENSPVLSSFLLYHILRLLYYYFDLGFRLELFVPYEFSYVYWYFGEIVSKSLVNMVDRNCNLMILQYSKLAATEKNNKKKSGKKHHLRQKAENELRKNVALMQQRILVHRVETTLAFALFKFSLGMETSGRLFVPKGEQIRYQRRVNLFSTLPSMLHTSYEDYWNSSGVKDYKAAGPDQCFGDAHEHFEQALSLLKSLEGNESDTQKISSLMKIAKQNAVVSKLMQSSSKFLNRNAVFEFSPDDRLMFPVIKLV